VSSSTQLSDSGETRRTGAPKVWLVEDNLDDERLTVRSLSKTSFKPEVFVSRDGEQALDRVQSLSDADIPDLVLLDLKLPKASGFEVLQAIRSSSLLKEVAVVVLTSSDEPMDMEQAWALGANDYVKKPVDYQGYQAAIDSVTRLWLFQSESEPVAAPTLIAAPTAKSSFGLYLS